MDKNKNSRKYAVAVYSPHIGWIYSKSGPKCVVNATVF
jgi:hypothetical protein